MKFDLSKDCAIKLDKIDPLGSFRKEFYYPKTNGNNEGIYLCGNSLGLQPKSASKHIKKELKIWEEKGALGQHSRWEHFHERLIESTARLVGAKNDEVVVMNALTVNLHLLMISFYQPNKNKNKIIIESGAFPSDQYAIDSQVKLHGLDPKDAIIELKPRNGENSIHTEDIIQTIDNYKNELSMVLMGGVNYYTGQAFDLKTITKSAHSVGAIAGFDLAHAAGNVPLELSSWDVDFASWCSYKYLNSGPGGISGIYVNKKHHNSKLKRLEGWWGVKEEERFKMNKNFLGSGNVDAWQLSNPSILSMAAHKASLDIFMEAGMDKLVKKSKLLTSYLEFLINDLVENRLGYEIITPKEPEYRGCQISFMISEGAKDFHDFLFENNIVVDFREPNVIRISPVPLYNSFLDVFLLYSKMKEYFNNINK